MNAVGIIGLGTFLPPHIRTNDWWPSAEVQRWEERMATRATRAVPPMDGLSSGARAALAAMASFGADPFRGARARRVMSPEQTSADMEAAAARVALERAGVGFDQIDAVLGSSMCPEYLHVNHACQAHRLLGLRRDVFTLATEGICNAFALHATLATAMIQSGQARYVLSLHSSAMTRVQGASEPHSAWFGDGAAAVVFGPVQAGRGLLGASHNADGAGCAALVLGVPGKRWWEDGPSSFHAVDHEATRAMLLTIVDHATQAVGDALAAAGLGPDQVDFYASHQGMPWLTEATKQATGLDRADTIVTFPELANMSSVNVPMILAMAEAQGRLVDDAVVATFTGGTGETWSSLVLRWGR